MSISDAGVIRVSRHLSVAPERAFDAWVDPAVARQWLFATPGGQIVRCDIDARPGGTFVITDRRDGEDVEHVGTYAEVDRPRRLAFTLGVPKYSIALSAVEVTVGAHDGEAEVVIDACGVPAEWREQTEQGWRDLLDRLEDVLQG
jgi:uncharacterized protein YndB with AHSA1/START domain